jgi:N-acetylneuraminate lyase
MTRFEGLIAAPHAPFRADGELNLAAVERQASVLLEQGVRGAFINGSTGEGPSLTVAERMAVAERWADVARGELTLIVQVGENAQPAAVELAAHAGRIGADAIAALPPHYFRPEEVESLLAWLGPVGAAAPGLPFFYYHIPSMTGVSLPMAAVLEQGRERLPNLAGLKFSEPDLMGFQECLAVAGDDLTLFWGCDEVLLGALAVGARGAVGSTYNHSAGLYHRMMAAHAGGDHPAALACSRNAVALVRAMAESGSVLAASKALMERLGVECGPPRPPLRTLTGEQKRQLFARVEALEAAGP